jgi:hypothetical protein
LTSRGELCYATVVVFLCSVIILAFLLSDAYKLEGATVKIVSKNQTYNYAYASREMAATAWSHPNLFGHPFESIRLICDIKASLSSRQPINVLTQTCGTWPPLNLPAVVFIHCSLGNCTYLDSDSPFHPIGANYFETTAQNGPDRWKLDVLWPLPNGPVRAVHPNAHFLVSTGNEITFQDRLTLLQFRPLVICTDNNICRPNSQIINETSGK